MVPDPKERRAQKSLDMSSIVVYPVVKGPLRQGNGRIPSAGSPCLFPRAIRLSKQSLCMIKISSDIPGRIKVAFSYNAEVIAKIKTVKAHRWHPEGKY